MVQNNMGFTQEMMMAMTRNWDQSQIEALGMICYNCSNLGIDWKDALIQKIQSCGPGLQGAGA
jgi:hypothetical protein